MNPIIKRMLSLMVFVALFFAVFMGGVEWKHSIMLEAQKTFNTNIIEALLLAILFPVVLGLLLGLPRLYKEFHKHGAWRLDLIPLVIIGIPALYVLFFPVLFYSGTVISLPFSQTLFKNTDEAMMVSGIVLGYLIVVVWKRQV